MRISTPELSLCLTARNSTELADSILSLDDWTIGVVGKIFHRDSPHQSDLLSRLLSELRAGRRELLRETFGEYVLVVINRAEGEVFLYSDLLSIRPLFIYEASDRIVFGTDVWQMVTDDLVPANIDLDALCSWLLLDHVIGNDSMIQDLKRLPAASCARLSKTGLKVEAYRNFCIDTRHVPEEEILDRIETYITDSCRSVVAREHKLNCFLSGGFDSRYLLCVLNDLGADVRAHTVQYDSAEEDAARAVMEALGVEGSLIDVPGSVLDRHDGNPFYYGPWGFPAWKFVTEIPVRKFQLTHTLVDGLIGDELIRGYDYEKGVRDAIDKLGIGAGILQSYMFVEPYAFRPDLAKRIRYRVTRKIDSYFDSMTGDLGKTAFQWLLFNRKSTCHTTNHLYNQSQVETVHPFVCADLVDFRLESDSRQFDATLYKKLLSRRYPDISKIPHSNELPIRYSTQARLSWSIWRRLPSTLPTLLHPHDASAFRRGFVLSRLGRYALGQTTQFYVARQMLTISMLRRRLESIGKAIPWNEI